MCKCSKVKKQTKKKNQQLNFCFLWVTPIQLGRKEAPAPPTDQPFISACLAKSVMKTTCKFTVSVTDHILCTVKSREIGWLEFTIRKDVINSICAS